MPLLRPQLWVFALAGYSASAVQAQTCACFSNSAALTTNTPSIATVSTPSTTHTTTATTSAAPITSAAPAASATGSGNANADLPYVMLEVGDQGQVDSTNPDNWWGGPGPFYRNFPFDPDTGYTKEGFMYTVLGASKTASVSSTLQATGVRRRLIQVRDRHHCLCSRVADHHDGYRVALRQSDSHGSDVRIMYLNPSLASRISSSMYNPLNHPLHNFHNGQAIPNIFISFAIRWLYL